MLNFLFSAIGKLLVWLTKQLARLIALLVTQAVMHPRTSVSLATTAVGVALLGWQLSCAILGSTVVALSTWKAAHPATFAATVGAWTRTWWRKWWIYRRTWVEAMTRCDLVVQGGKGKREVFLPKLRAVRSTPHWDHLTIEMQIGQAPGAFFRVEDELRLAFKGERSVLRPGKPRLLHLSLMHRDPLLEAVPATGIPPSAEAINWKAVPVGLDEFGEPYCVSLLGGHTSVAGSTGAGKASLEWNVLRGIAPAIPAGLVRPVLIDPKRKELVRLKHLVAAGDYAATPEDVRDLLRRLVDEMDAANEADGAAGERDFQPRPGRPLTLILIDELAPLLHLWERRIRNDIEDSLGLLLTQGRAAGFIVLGAIQEPTKDVFRCRDLFTRRIALRLPTESHTEAALIEKAVDYGALCHEISESTPGVLFSLQDGARRSVRARFGYVDDHALDELVSYLEERSKVVELTGRTGGKADVAA